MIGTPHYTKTGPGPNKEVMAGLCILGAVIFNVLMTTAFKQLPYQCKYTNNNGIECRHIEQTQLQLIARRIPTDINSISITDSHLMTISDEFSFQDWNNLTSLKILHSGVTGIDPKAFVTMPSLQELYLSHNSIKTLEREQFRHMVNLRVLDLGKNEITLTEGCFEHLKLLQELHLEYNQIRYLLPSQLSGLSKLMFLDLRGNQMYFIHNLAFIGNTDLLELHLEHNLLGGLEEDVIKPLKSVQNIFLGHNPWDCSCRLQWLYNFIQNRTKTVINDSDLITCHTPDIPKKKKVPTATLR